MKRFFVLTGCSGGGKSTLLEALAQAGFATIPEPGRRIVAEALAGDGTGLPWEDMRGFTQKALALAEQDWEQAQSIPGPVFFDRGLIDAACACEHATGQLPPEAATLGSRYNSQVFLAPPWQALFTADAERRHSFREAVEEFARLEVFLPRFGYRVTQLPQAPVAERLAFVRTRLSA
ncbi:MAG: AAA family ATPase [Pararhodobacter sp.]